MVQKQTHCYLPLQFLLIASAIVFFPLSALAQRVPIADDTLGDEGSIVSPDEVIRGVSSNRINGGARRGANLFHSFREFNVDEGRGVYFSNPDGVANILTRVTGGNRSDILGTLGVLGNANLFLINPSGTLFGSGARLDVSGSFLVSTADSLVFDNGFAFSATNSQAPPLLTVNVPIGLQYGSDLGAIQVQSTILEVPNGRSLTLAGGAVVVDRGQLFAPGGRVELAGIAAPGQVGLTQQGQEWRLSVPEGLGRADVTIGNGAVVAVNSVGGGNIAIIARNLTITESETLVIAGIAPSSGSLDAQAGNIDINVTEAINIDESSVANVVLEGTGDAGDINVITDSLSLTNGASMNVNTFGQGNAGNIDITARDAVSFDRAGSGVDSGVGDGASGRGGNIRITTGRFSLINGARVGGSTLGRGDAGTFTLIAKDTVFLEDSTLANQVFSTAIGQGGDINITTGSLFITNGALISASTNGRGDAGDINITASDAVSLIGRNGRNSTVATIVTDEASGQGGNINITTGALSLTDAGLLSTSTYGRGDAGDINITVSDAVSFGGVDYFGFAFSEVSARGIGRGGDINITAGSLSFTRGSGVSTSTLNNGDAGDITITVRDAVSFDGVDSDGTGSGAFSKVYPEAEGQGGTIRVNAERFSITNGAELSASSEEQGRAGNLEVNAQHLSLDNQGRIVAETASGQGGDIRLQVLELLLLRQGSSISTTAGTAQAGGNGGNITFDGRFIAALPNENSDISANAFTGRGGNVEVNTQSTFGIQARPQPTLQSDITASSERGIAGTVSINTPDVDPSRGLVQLPIELTDASQLIAQTCPTGDSTANQRNQFIVTGRGGLPPTPSEAVNQDAIQVDLVTAIAEDAPAVSQTELNPNHLPSESPIVEAQGLQIAADGTAMLVAAAPQSRFSSASSERIASSSNHIIQCR